MESIEYVKAFTNIMRALFAVGVTCRCLYICVTGMFAEEEMKDIIQKITKNIKVLIFAMCLSELVVILEGFYGWEEGWKTNQENFIYRSILLMPKII